MENLCVYMNNSSIQVYVTDYRFPQNSFFILESLCYFMRSLSAQLIFSNWGNFSFKLCVANAISFCGIVHSSDVVVHLNFSIYFCWNLKVKVCSVFIWITVHQHTNVCANNAYKLKLDIAKKKKLGRVRKNEIYLFFKKLNNRKFFCFFGVNNQMLFLFWIYLYSTELEKIS